MNAANVTAVALSIEKTGTVPARLKSRFTGCGTAAADTPVTRRRR
jgi:hypothetical protein